MKIRWGARTEPRRPGESCPPGLLLVPLHRVVIALAVASVLLWHGLLRPAWDSAMPKRARHGSSEVEQTTLRLLLVGDVHDRLDRLQQLVSELGDDAKEAIDVVLLDGDLANVPKPDMSRPDDSLPWLPGIAKQLSTLDEFMLRVHKRASSVYYIPGNHDPPQLFDSTETERAAEREPDLKRGHNIHAAAARLAPNLCVRKTLPDVVDTLCV